MMIEILKCGKRPSLAALALLLTATACAGSTPAPATPKAATAPAVTPSVAAPAATPTAPAATAPAAAAPALPAGVLRVLIGEGIRDRSATGIPRCMIPQPLPAPQRFEPGTTEIAYTIDVDPQVVKGVTAKVVGDLGCAEPWSQGCPGYTVCGGGVCQNQYGATVKCPGDKPLKKGSYKLSFTVGERTVELPFEIQ
jgi:hypothetical protein